MFFLGLTGWEDRLLISDRAHLGRTTFYNKELFTCQLRCDAA